VRSFDLLGRVIEEDAPVNESSPSGAITTTQYLGESVWVTDAEGHTTKTETNAVGQVVKVTDANGNYATYTYKPFGELASMTDAENNTTTVSYDPRGFKNGMSDPNMGDWDYEYTIYGELSSQTNALDQTTTLTYDEAGRLYQRSEVEGTTTWSYYSSGTGAIGKPSTITAPDSYAEYFWYNSTNGQPSQHQRVIDSATYQYNMTYDGLGRLDTLTYPESTSSYRFKVDYDYDAYGHLQYVKDGNETYTYYTLNATDALGRPTDVDLGNGRSETWDFDKAAGYLENITTDGSVQNLSMTYDEVGNVLTRADSLISKTETFGYDDVNRLTSSQVTGQSTVNIYYSAAGRITEKTGCSGGAWGMARERPALLPCRVPAAKATPTTPTAA
jgi:YD repeat-containing protein